NFDLFMVLPRSAARIADAAKLELSSKDRSNNREAGHLIAYWKNYGRPRQLAIRHAVAVFQGRTEGTNLWLILTSPPFHLKAIGWLRYSIQSTEDATPIRWGEPSIFAIERVLLWLILSANGAATIFLIVVLLRNPAPASLVPSGLIDGLMLVVGWIAGGICGF